MYNGKAHCDTAWADIMMGGSHGRDGIREILRIISTTSS
jgi:hypothetical protein